MSVTRFNQFSITLKRLRSRLLKLAHNPWLSTKARDELSAAADHIAAALEDYLDHV